MWISIHKKVCVIYVCSHMHADCVCIGLWWVGVDWLWCVCVHLVVLVCKGECSVVRQSGASLSPWVHSTHSADASANTSLSSPESMWASERERKGKEEEPVHLLWNILVFSLSLSITLAVFLHLHKHLVFSCYPIPRLGYFLLLDFQKWGFASLYCGSIWRNATPVQIIASLCFIPSSGQPESPV